MIDGARSSAQLPCLGAGPSVATIMPLHRPCPHGKGLRLPRISAIDLPGIIVIHLRRIIVIRLRRIIVIFRPCIIVILRLDRRIRGSTSV